MLQEVLTRFSVFWPLQILVAILLIYISFRFILFLFKKDKVKLVLGKYPVISLFLVSIIFFFELEISNHNVFFKNMSIVHIGVNVLTLFSLLILLYVLFNKAWISIMILNLGIAILAIANYYTLHFRGTPVTAQDIPAIGTALNATSDLKFSLQIVATIILSVAVCCGWYAFNLKKIEIRNTLIVRAVFFVVAFVFLWFIYFCEYSPKPANTSTWIWRDQYWTYGYTACSFESVQRALNIIEKPKEYSVEAVEQVIEKIENEQAKQADERMQQPDIILVLNETFYDFDLIHDFGTTTEVTPFLDTMENTIRGYTVVPTIGGGTNRSEYELLTSNSLYLMRDILPFWSLDFKEANSIVSVLEQQGYYTMAFHQGTRSNYNRDKKYIEMGFDDYYASDNMNEDELYYVHGNISDLSGYEYLIDKYENRDPNKPFFAYNLTMQNHISYRTDVNITVSTTSGFDGMQEQADIYMSCLKESDKAFQYLVEYFSNVERPVIICMVGDHGPDYAAKVKKKSDLNPIVNKYGEKMTPFYIWSNWGLEEDDWNIISLPYLLPKILRIAGVESSNYYEYMADMSESIPILTAYDSVADKEGNIYAYDNLGVYEETILEYWYLEYYNVHEKKRRKNVFFESGE